MRTPVHPYQDSGTLGQSDVLELDIRDSISKIGSQRVNLVFNSVQPGLKVSNLGSEFRNVSVAAVGLPNQNDHERHERQYYAGRGN